MNLIIFAISAILGTSFIDLSAASGKVVCYYGSWAVYRPGDASFNFNNVEPSLCTNFIYVFVGVGDDGSVKILDAWRDLEDGGGMGGFKQCNALKQQNPNIKTSIAIGGWNAGAAVFSRVCASDSLRATFVQNIVAFVKKYGFDGFDLDWEYPANADRGGKPEDVANFAKLCQELHDAFQPQGLLLSAAVAATGSVIKNYYDIPQISKYLDFINVMAYDLHGSWDGRTGENAPLYASSQDVSPFLNVKSCIESWIQFGADPAKLILGTGMYGRSYTLADRNNHGINAPSSGAGTPGPSTGEAGMLGYNEIVKYLSNGQWTEVWNDEQKVPYAYSGDQWVGYDNEKSIALKCQFAKDKNLGGVMIWSIDTDDFQNKKYTLLREINKYFGFNV